MGENTSSKRISTKLDDMTVDYFISDKHVVQWVETQTQDFHKQIMEDILTDVGLTQLKDAFNRNRITPRDVLCLSEAEFLALGVETIGDRVRLRERCRDETYADGSNSPNTVVNRVTVFQDNRKGRGKGKGKGKKSMPYRKPKQTRRIQIGWKHMSKPNTTYQLINANKGGGTFTIDIEKESTLEEVKREVADKYFPLGENVAQGVKLKDIHYYLANFTGLEIGQQKTNVEEMYTIGDFLKDFSSSPVRIYLYTRMKFDDADQTVDMAVKHGEQTSGSGKQTSGSGEQTSCSGEQTSGSGEQTFEAALEATTVQTIDHSGDEQANSSGDSFEDTVTPTISFRNRNRFSLSLSQRRARVQSHSETASASSPSAANHSVFYIEVTDSDDEELQRAIEASSNEPTSQRSSATVELALTEFQGYAVDASQSTKIIVKRSNILESTLTALDRKSMNLKATLYVKFSGEIGEDFGGPRREFFRLALNALHQSRFFDGPDTDKYFSHDLLLLEKGHYNLIGRLVALSLVQGGPGLHFLSGQLFDVMVGLNVDLSNVELVFPPEVDDIIRQLEDVDTDEKKDRFLIDHGDRLIDLGFNDPYRMTVDKKGAVLHMLKKHYLYYRTAGEISQFTDGMNVVGNAWDFVKDRAEQFKSLFCHMPRHLSSDDITRLFTVQYS